MKGRLRWLDSGTENKEKLVTNDPTLDLIHKEEGIPPITNHKSTFSGKSVLKNKLEQI